MYEAYPTQNRGHEYTFLDAQRPAEEVGVQQTRSRSFGAFGPTGKDGLMGTELTRLKGVIVELRNFGAEYVKDAEWPAYAALLSKAFVRLNR